MPKWLCLSKTIALDTVGDKLRVLEDLAVRAFLMYGDVHTAVWCHPCSPKLLKMLF